MARHSRDEVEREVVPVLLEVADDIRRTLDEVPQQARWLRLSDRSSFCIPFLNNGIGFGILGEKKTG